MSDAPLVSVIVVTFNGRHHLGACLDSLRRQQVSASFEVIVIDNASGDGTAEEVRSNYAWVRLLELSRNQGFAGGNNAGRWLRKKLADRARNSRAGLIHQCFDADAAAECGLLRRVHLRRAQHRRFQLVLRLGRGGFLLFARTLPWRIRIRVRRLLVL